MIRFIRRDEGSATETLTLVRLDDSSDLAIQIETGTPETWAKDPNDRTFVGLYDLDGDQLQLGNKSWEIVEAVEFVGDEARMLARALEIDAGWREDEDPALDACEVAEALRNAWECGTSVCEAA